MIDTWVAVALGSFVVGRLVGSLLLARTARQALPTIPHPLFICTGCGTDHGRDMTAAAIHVRLAHRSAPVDIVDR